MAMIGKVLIAIITVSGLAITFSTVFQLTLFLSSFSHSADDVNLTSYSDVDGVPAAVRSSIVDMSLLMIFILLHSFVSAPLHKLVLLVDLEYMHRIFYNLITSAVLQVLMIFWQPIPDHVLWNVNLDESPMFKLLFIVLHVSSWLLLYVMAISLDITEILGIKWVHYNLMGLVRRNSNEIYHQPSNKSNTLSSLSTSIQHPGFICLTIILWIYPLMRLDRLFLAVIWTVYMALAWDSDQNDFNYAVEQRQKKFIS